MATVYISSTYGDLKKYRKAVYDILGKMKQHRVAMEDYVATGNHPPLDKCLADVADCDWYIGIFAWRYGYIPTENNPEKKSFTELEYRQAQKLGKPCFIFLLDEKARWPSQHRDTETGECDEGILIEKLRKELQKEKLVSFFKNPNELGSLVSTAIYNWEKENFLNDDNTAIQSHLDEDIQENIPRPRYTLLNKLSESSVASVYKARDNELERNIAIKVLHCDNLKENFKKSITKAVNISNEPNFITIYDACFNRKYYFYTMQFIEGDTIRKYLDKKIKLSFKEICGIILKLGEALIRARDRGFPCKNLKPSNILLVRDDKNNQYDIFISCLDLSEELSNQNILEHLNELQARHKKEYMEELAYLIPEQFMFEGVKPIKFKQSAQYSLGLLAYELFTNEIPNTSQEHKALVEKDYEQAFQKLPPFRHKCSHCTQIIETIILKMASPKPEDRYEDIQDAIELIRHHLDFNLNTVKESYKRCAQVSNFDTIFFDTFYQNFIGKCPEAKHKFSTFEEKDWKRQHQLLKQAVLVLFAYFEEKEQLDSLESYEQADLNILTRIAEIHDRYHKKIPKNMYKAFVNALIETVIEFDSWCKESEEIVNQDRKRLVKYAWDKVLTPGVEYMQSKY